MKILIHTDDNIDNTFFLIDYLRNILPDMLRDVILIDSSGVMKEWASKQMDFTYIYFEEEASCGSMFNQVINGLEINDDILITDNYHLPLAGSFERLLDTLAFDTDAFAAGPVSNSFTYWQEIDWDNAEAALDWSESITYTEPEEVLNLRSGVILISRAALQERPFCENTNDVEDMILEKCIREFLSHKKMYVCKSSGFWDTRAGRYKETLNILKDGVSVMLDRQFGMHYLNVMGNLWLTELIEETIDHDQYINILEIGCDCGGTLFELKKTYKKACIYGTDINNDSLRFASEFAITKLNNIEEQNLDFDVKFDLIIFGDVLEHLRDPLSAVKYCKTLLNPGGRIAASIPNLMNISVMKLLLNGRFPYMDSGLLDRTHIHMFTYNEMVQLFVNDAGLRIEKLTMNGSLSEADSRLADELLKLGNAEKFMYQAFQYQVIAVNDC